MPLTEGDCTTMPAAMKALAPVLKSQMLVMVFPSMTAFVTEFTSMPTGR